MTSGSAGGVYPTTVTIGTLTATTYTVTLVNGSVTVSAHVLNVTAMPQTKVYGASVPTLT